MLVDALVTGASQHQARCPDCRQHGRSCAGIRTGIELVLEWRQSRILLSRAEWLRREQTVEQALREWELRFFPDGRPPLSEVEQRWLEERYGETAGLPTVGEVAA